MGIFAVKCGGSLFFVFFKNKVDFFAYYGYIVINKFKTINKETEMFNKIKDNINSLDLTSNLWGDEIKAHLHDQLFKIFNSDHTESEIEEELYGHNDVDDLFDIDDSDLELIRSEVYHLIVNYFKV